MSLEPTAVHLGEHSGFATADDFPPRPEQLESIVSELGQVDESGGENGSSPRMRVFVKNILTDKEFLPRLVAKNLAVVRTDAEKAGMPSVGGPNWEKAFPRI